MITLHAPIKVRRTMTIRRRGATPALVDTTMGRIIFNNPIPQDLGYVDRTDPHQFDYEMNPRTLKIASGGKSDKLTKTGLPDIISRCMTKHGTEVCARCWISIKAQGYKYSTLSRHHRRRVAMPSSPPRSTDPGRRGREEDRRRSRKKFNRGLISDEERYNSVVEIWQAATEEVSDALAERTCDQRQPHLYDGRLRCPWFHGPDPSAGRHARPDG